MRQPIIAREVRHVIAILLAGATFGLAQEYRGRVQGVVGDPSGAVIPGVTVVLKNDATNVEVNKADPTAKAATSLTTSIRELTP